MIITPKVSISHRQLATTLMFWGLVFLSFALFASHSAYSQSIQGGSCRKPGDGTLDPQSIQLGLEIEHDSNSVKMNPVILVTVKNTSNEIVSLYREPSETAYRTTTNEGGQIIPYRFGYDPDSIPILSSYGCLRLAPGQFYKYRIELKYRYNFTPDLYKVNVQMNVDDRYPSLRKGKIATLNKSIDIDLR